MVQGSHLFAPVQEFLGLTSDVVSRVYYKSRQKGERLTLRDALDACLSDVVVSDIEVLKLGQYFSD